MDLAAALTEQIADNDVSDTLTTYDGGAAAARKKLNTALNQLEAVPLGEVAEFGAKLQMFRQTLDVLGEDDLRVVRFAISLLVEACPLFPSKMVNGSEGARGRISLRPPLRPRRQPLPRTDLSTLFGWSRRSQSPE